MSEQNYSQSEFEDTSIYAIHTLKTFVKAKLDWIEFDKMHLSFVEHDGNKANAKQLHNIEAALSIGGENGILALYELATNGELATRRKASLETAEKQSANGGKAYPKPVFESLGGTSGKRSKEGKTIFRSVTITPGTKVDYVLQSMQCEGELTSTGAITPKKNVAQTRIMVAMSNAQLLAFLSTMKAYWTAHITSKMLGAPPISASTGAVNAPSAPPAVVNEPAQTLAPPVVGVIPIKQKELVCVIFNANGGTLEVARMDVAQDELQRVIREMLYGDKHLVVVNKDEYDAIKNTYFSGKGKTGTSELKLVSKDDSSFTDSLFIVVQGIL